MISIRKKSNNIIATNSFFFQLHHSQTAVGSAPVLPQQQQPSQHCCAKCGLDLHTKADLQKHYFDIHGLTRVYCHQESFSNVFLFKIYFNSPNIG